MTTNMSIRDALYEAPGKKTKRRIAVATGLSVLVLTVLIILMIRQFYVTGQLGEKYWSLFTKPTTWAFLGQGLLVTVEVALCAAVMAFVLGFVFMRARLSGIRAVRWLGMVLTEFSRGVPTLLFIYFFFLIVPQLGIRMSSFWKIACPCAISACGVVAEVFRSGVNAVPRGQREAALSLGLSERKTFYRIIFPQALRYVIPTLIAELVIVLKDTTFAYVVSCADLMQNAKVLISNYDALLSVYLVVAIIYILINYLLNKLSDRMTRRMKRTGSKAA